jgi:sulfatase maturation enzyme AslB (radical SAM superfamily)
MQLLKGNDIGFAISYLVTEETADSWDYVHSIGNLYSAFVGWSLERSGTRYNTKSELPDKFIFNCPGLKTTFAISPGGGVYACDDYRDELCAGNLYDTPFDEMNFRPVWDYIASGACQPCGILCHARKAIPVLPYEMFQRQG